MGPVATGSTKGILRENGDIIFAIKLILSI